MEATVIHDARPLPPLPLGDSSKESNQNLGAALPCSVITEENTEHLKKKLNLEIELLQKQVETASATAEVEKARVMLERAKVETEEARAKVEKARAEVELLRLQKQKSQLILENI